MKDKAKIFALLMKLEEKIRQLHCELLNWYSTNGRIFPWRIPNLTSYEYIISEVLLQRTKAENVAEFYDHFIKSYPSWNALDSAKQEDLANFLKPIGLYNQRSVRLKKLAHEMTNRDGVLPITRKELEQIPLFGQYIVNSIFQLVHNHPEPLLDVNMARFLERVFDKRKLVDIRYDKDLQLLAKKIISHSNSKELNWAILDYAAMICKPKPVCDHCIISKKCNSFNL